MSNDKKKIKLISLLLDQWTTDKYATRLVDKNLAHVTDEEVFGLTCEDARLFPNIQTCRYYYTDTDTPPPPNSSKF